MIEECEKKVLMEMVYAGSTATDPIDMDTRINVCFKLFLDYIESGMIQQTFYGERNITAEMFSKAMQFIRNYDYTKGFGTLNLDYVNLFIDTKDKVDYVIKRLHEGKFDIIDYYETTNLLPEAFLTFARLYYKGSDIRNIARIFSTNGSNNYFIQDIAKIGISDKTEEILNMSVQYMNKDGKVVAIDDITKGKIIAYLKHIGSPIVDRTFLTAARRYVNGDLNIEIDSNEKALKR